MPKISGAYCTSHFSEDKIEFGLSICMILIKVQSWLINELGLKNHYL